MSKGVIRALRDLIVRVEFDEDLPTLNEVVVVDNDQKTQLLVSSILPGNVAVCLNVMADRTIQKGQTVSRTGHGLEISVGDALIGRVVDALGQPIDGGESLTDLNLP